MFGKKNVWKVENSLVGLKKQSGRPENSLVGQRNSLVGQTKGAIRGSAKRRTHKGFACCQVCW